MLPLSELAFQVSVSLLMVKSPIPSQGDACGTDHSCLLKRLSCSCVIFLILTVQVVHALLLSKYEKLWSEDCCEKVLFLLSGTGLWRARHR